MYLILSVLMENEMHLLPQYNIDESLFSYDKYNYSIRNRIA